ncbi:MAG: hypothetical protein GY926_02165 [bacterium]|nr:hypothetical protein [bacterium]
MYQSLLQDTSFFALLLQIDEDLAAEVRAAGCPCGGPLHSARYRRKPRGGPASLGRAYNLRASFCCAVEGCRRRATPPSVRFLGRKVFFGLWVVLLPVLREGPKAQRLSRLEERFRVSRRTLLRWRRWWRETFPASRFWQAARGLWSQPVATEALPGSLLAAFASLESPGEQVLAVLQWLAPLSSSRSWV